MSFSLEAAKRRIRPQRRAGRLTPRSEGELPFADQLTLDARPLLLDTCVYIDQLQRRSPPAVERLLRNGVFNHSAVCLAELTHLIGALDPARIDTRLAQREIEGTIDDIPPHRLTAPSDRAFGESGMLAGLVTRLAGERRPRALQNDALLYLHALERGFIILTRNIRDFDFFDQLLPSGRVLFYRRTD